MNGPALAYLRLTIAILAVAILSCSDAAAQADADSGAGGTVTGSGAVTVSRQPNVLRMTIELPAEGKDIREAIVNLKKERTALAAKIEKLGAAKDKVTFSEPRVGGTPGGAMSTQQQMVRQMMRMQRAGGRAAAGKEVPDGAPPKVAVSLTVTAEWPLAEQSPEEFVVAGYTLREKLRAGGLSKAPEPKELTPEEQEEMEELAGMMDEEEGTAAPGEPSFVFVSRFTAEERDNAMAEAFKKARAEATRLATAAGASLGDLRTVNGSTSADGADDDGDMYGYQRAMMIQMGMNRADPGIEEGTTSEPGPVSMRVTVTATFGMK